MKKCPKWNHLQLTKDGFMKGDQRYKCKSCKYRSILKQSPYRSSISTKRKALQLYLEGLGFRSIGRILGFSHVLIYRCLKSYGEKIGNLKSSETIKHVELDEMHTYVLNKKTLDGFGYLLIGLGKSLSIVLLEKGTR